jgi:hypothetical protein
MSTTATATQYENFVGRGDFTKERRERPQRTGAEIDADIQRLQAEYPERLTIRPVRWTEDE